MSALRFCFVLHLHQPVGNFDHVFREHADDVYTPFLDFLERRALWPVALHVSGPLLEWLGEHDRALHDRFGTLAADGRIELLSAGWYEPVLASLSRADRAEQLGRMRDELRSRFGVEARGAWLTERVWEPDVAADLAADGIRYALVDDHLALRAGVAPGDVAYPLRTEADGRSLDLFAIDERLRYLIPFRAADEISDDLRARWEQGAPLAFFGDDFEKFGGWPRTKEWLYEGGWLESFGDAMDVLRGEGVVRWVTPAQALAEVEGRGPVYLPTGSYMEMEGWARGGHWKGFLSRYPEANRMHKRMLALSAASRERGDPPAVRQAIARAQCNDAYWHGVFGGLYMKHLREGVRRELLEAERTLRAGDPFGWTRRDVDADGREEWWLHGDAISAWVREDGTVSELVRLRERVDVLDVLTRSREAYHLEAHRRAVERREAAGESRGGDHAEYEVAAGGGESAADGTASIHDVEGAAVLDRLPPVDRETRVLVRERVLTAETTEAEYREGAYEPVWSCGDYLRADPDGPSSGGTFRIELHTDGRPRVEKSLRIEADGTATYTWRWDPSDFPEGARFAPEISLGADVPVSWSPEVEAWRWPIVTTSKCPDGFEEIEQGTSLTPLWPVGAGSATVVLPAGQESDTGV